MINSVNVLGISYKIVFFGLKNGLDYYVIFIYEQNVRQSEQTTNRKTA